MNVTDATTIFSYQSSLKESDNARDEKLQKFVVQHEQSHIMTGCRGMRLHYCFYPNRGCPLVVVAPGRAEAAFKYREFAYDCWHQGYSVAIIDHRGQGASQRFFSDPQRAHMDDFDRAAGDLVQIAERCSYGETCFVAGHSMGASICLRALQTQPHPFKKAALIAPMLSLPIPFQSIIIEPYLGLRALWEKRQWKRHKKIPGYISKRRRDYFDAGFQGNTLTTSAARYTAFRQIYIDHPTLQLGGPTAGWLYQSIRMMNAIQRDAAKLDIPMLFAIAGNDQIVSKKGGIQLHKKLVNRSIYNKWQVLSGSSHEPLMEVDTIRNELMGGNL